MAFPSSRSIRARLALLALAAVLPHAAFIAFDYYGDVSALTQLVGQSGREQAGMVEAMSSHRPYRPGLGIDKALAGIERGRGTAYDPVVADACLKLFREKSYAIPA